MEPVEKTTKSEPCPQCRKEGGDTSGDNLKRYPDGGAHCFACGYHVHGDGTTVEKAKAHTKLTKPIMGKLMPLNHRKIDQKTTRLFDYRMAKLGEEVVEVENFYREGTLVAQHIRGKNKSFSWRGETDKLPLFGQHLWSGGGKRIVVTEGAIDAMTISMLQKNRWPVVSVPNGTSHAPKAIKTNLDFLSGYDEIVLCFDNDEPGRAAAEKCAEILPPGKVRIAITPRKDANDHLLANDTQSLITALYEARQYQPDGIMHVSDVNDEVRPSQDTWLFPWDCLTKSLMGQRSGEMTMWASGTGSGKSTIIRELAMDHLNNGRTVGMLMLEESPQETLDDMVSLLLCKPVRQIKSSRALNALLTAKGKKALSFDIIDNLTDDEYVEARKVLSTMPLYIYDHRGSNAFDNILSRIEYMASALECDVIILDHVTAVIAGMGRDGSEREGIDDLMKSLRSIVERTGCHLDVVTQLNRLEGKAAEEGGQISLKNLRGSGSLGSVPNSVLAVERNQQADSPEERMISKVRVLKGRFNGLTGVAGYLKFDPETRRIDETDWTESNQAGATFDGEQDEHTEQSDSGSTEQQADLTGLTLGSSGDDIQPERTEPAKPARASNPLDDLA